MSSPSPRDSAVGRVRRRVAVAARQPRRRRWLPTVLDGLAAQTRCADRMRRGRHRQQGRRAGPAERALGADHVVTAAGQTSYAEAVELGLALLDELGPDPRPSGSGCCTTTARPRPGGARARCSPRPTADPDADVLGPKLREWPSLRRLLELGVTISGTGRRETGLERGEYDQGQHDEVRAGARGQHRRHAGAPRRARRARRLRPPAADLRQRPRLRLAGRRAPGYRTLVVPAGGRLPRRGGAPRLPAHAARPAGTRTTRSAGPRCAPCSSTAAAARCRGRWCGSPLGTIVRMVGFLLVRSRRRGARRPRRAGLGLLAAPASCSRRDARADGPAATAGTPRPPAPLLSPWWVPYRHGLDFVSDLAAALTNQAADVAERRRAAAIEREAAEAAAGPGVRGQDAPAARRASDRRGRRRPARADSGLLARFLTSPVAVGLAVFVVAVLAGDPAGLGHGVRRRARRRRRDAAGDWWGLYAESWHPLALGTPCPLRAVLVLPLALLGLAARRQRRRRGEPGDGPRRCPLALWGAWRLLRVVGRLPRSRRACRAGWSAAGAATYALVPGVSGAWGDGRLGLVVLRVAVLPWLAHAALGFADPEADRRWRAAWRTGLLLALATACAPLVFVVLLVLVLVVAGPGAHGSLADLVRGPLGVRPAAGRPRRGAGAARAVVAAPPAAGASGRAAARARPAPRRDDRRARPPARPPRRARRARVAGVPIVAAALLALVPARSRVTAAGVLDDRPGRHPGGGARRGAHRRRARRVDAARRRRGDPRRHGRARGGRLRRGAGGAAGTCAPPTPPGSAGSPPSPRCSPLAVPTAGRGVVRRRRSRRPGGRRAGRRAGLHEPELRCSDRSTASSSCAATSRPACATPCAAATATPSATTRCSP